MTYDFILMNPPYDKNLHLKIVEQSIPMLTDDGILVNLSPIRWLQDPLAKYKKSSDWYKFKEIRSHLSNLMVIDSQEASLMFSNEMTANLGVYVINNKCNKPYEGVSSTIIDKVVGGKSLADMAQYDHSDGWRCRLTNLRPLAVGKKSYSRAMEIRRKFYVTNDLVSWVYNDGYTESGIHWTQNVVAKSGHELPDGTPLPISIPFINKETAINFEESTKTTFYKYLHYVMKADASAEPLGYLPWMGDCTNPRTGKKGYEGEWTDDDFRAYFGITDSEWEEIVETMKPYWM